MDCPPKKVAVVERWPVTRGSTVLIYIVCMTLLRYLRQIPSVADVTELLFLERSKRRTVT